MKNITPLRLEELSTDQKLGMSIIGGSGPEHIDYSLELIKNRSLGAIWVHPQKDGSHREIIKKVKDAADYPILIVCDMEGGYPGRSIGAQAALTFLDDPEETYRFARSCAAMAREDGYNVVCSPVMECIEKRNRLYGVNRMFGADKETVAVQAEAFIRGFRDAGIIPFAKHYPSIISRNDSHLRETVGMQTESELLRDNLYPYIKLLEKGLLDGIMVQHARLPNIDPEHPATISEKVTSIIRRKGFDGVLMTDDLNMMGILAKYGKERYSRAVAGGNDLLIAYGNMTKECYAKLKEDHAGGLLTDMRVDEAARRVLKMQEMTLAVPVHPSVTPEDLSVPDSINRRSIILRKDDGIPSGIDTAGHHLFVVMTEYKEDLNGETNKSDYCPQQIASEIKERFPNSDIAALQHYPTRDEIIGLVHKQLKYDDVIVVANIYNASYLGEAAFTTRALAVFDSLQGTDRISALVFFGNPFAMEQLPHIKRIVCGIQPAASRYALDILAGIYVPQGKFPYEIDLK